MAQEDKSRLITDGPPGFAANAFDWDKNPPDHPYSFPHRIIVQVPQRGRLTIAELPRDNMYRLAIMQVWSEPATRPDHAFVCFEPTVGSEDALNRPADRLMIAPHSSQRIVLQLTAKPL